MDCQRESRRPKTREGGWNGLDYLEVSADQLRLSLFFLGRAPEGLTTANVRIEGGQRVRDIRVLDLEFHRSPDPRYDDCVVVTVDRPGDFSTYRICLVDLDEEGRGTDRPFPGFDPRYACLDFGFKVGCPSHLDCKQEEICPPEERAEPEIDYLARDYAGLRKLILDRLALIMPDWCERHVADVGITLVELLAYLGDRLSYYQDAVATEAYLDTSRQRVSVRRHARLVDYFLHEGCNARAWVCLTTDTELELASDEIAFVAADLPTGLAVMSPTALAELEGSSREIFEPVAHCSSPIRLRPAHNRIRFYTWADAECCLPRGSTAATLIDGWEPPPDVDDDLGKPDDDEIRDDDTWDGRQAGAAADDDRDDDGYDDQDEPPPTRDRLLDLAPGDVLIFEEVIGPGTGNPVDADPKRRHAVCLTRVEPAIDPVCDQPVVEVEWAEEDALPFALCISTRGPAPDCRLLEDVSVACGNVVLVDHGQTCDEDLGAVPVESTEERCGEPCEPPEIALVPGRFRPRLAFRPLTFCEPGRPCCPAREAIAQDPRRALPHIQVHEAATGAGWRVRRDLIASGRDDRHFTVELENDGRARLRFGNGDSGRQPAAGALLGARYRVGNGPAGNVGAEAINRAVDRKGLLGGVELTVRNPLPATGGTAPETMAEAKLFTPHQFRRVLARAVTAADYATIVERDFPQVQRAAATLRFTGSYQVMLVAVDQRDRLEAEPELVDEISRHLHRYRRIGHDVVVSAAEHVPLDLELVVCVEPAHLRGHVEAAVREALGNRRLPDGRTGFFHPDNLSFGEGVFVSRIVAAVQALDGVESVHVRRLERLFEGPRDELERGVLELGPSEIARLDNDRNLPENGVLTLDMRGGR